MAARPLTPEDERRLVDTWREAGEALAKLRRAALASQSPEESRQAAWDMLQLGGLLPPDPRRAAASGLVEMQRFLARAHARRR